MIRAKQWDTIRYKGKSPANSYQYETYQHVPEVIQNDLRVSNSNKTSTSLDTVYYFAGNTGDYDMELWRTNGTPDGTYRIVNVYQGGSAYPNELTMAGDKLISYPRELTEFDGSLVFNAWYGKRTLFRLKIHNTSTVDVENSPLESSLFRIYPNPVH